MVPVDQTKFGQGVGNCFLACVASIFECPLGDVPDFNEAGDRAWFGELEKWARPRGFYPMCFPIPEESDRWWWPEGYWILGGRNKREASHAVVARGDAIVHDPNGRFRDGISGPEDMIVFVAIDPGALLRRGA